MRKLSTHITGLDRIFLGGIQIDCLTSNNHKDNDSIVIVIRGEYGTSKHLLAMQLMHGLTKSIYERLKETENNRPTKPINLKTSQYFSINKPSDRLNDMYLDLLISRWIDAMTHASKREYLKRLDSQRLKQNNDKKTDDRTNKLEPNAVCNCSENTDNELECDVLEKQRQNAFNFLFCKAENKNLEFEDELRKLGLSLSELLTHNILSYNPRTNSIHYRRISQGDSEVNVLYQRKADTISEYRSYKNFPKHYLESSVDYNFDTDMVDVKFNSHLNYGHRNNNTTNPSQEDVVIDRNSKKALLSFFNILQSIENDLETWESPNEDSSKEGLPHEVVVIDGFSHLDDAALKSLPYGHLRKTLKKYARIAILVFDDRKTVDCDGDIVIDLRKNTDTYEEYSYFELQISKSVFQPYAFGWHQYKRREEGLTIFPSIHLLLTRRYYIADRIHDLGNGIFENSFSEYIESSKHHDIAIVDYSSPESLENLHNKFYLEQYVESQKDIIHNFIQHLKSQLSDFGIESNPKSRKGISDKATELPSEVRMSLLKKLILGFDSLPNKKGPDGWSSHYPTTAIIGNPNSFKRMLIMAKAYHWANNNEHVLFVLFGKSPQDMRKHMICPGIISSNWDINECCNKSNKCHECSKYIHFLGIRSGCISAEEFFHTLIEQIEIYCDRIPKFGFEKRRLHIIIDDFQRIDFSFPFIKNTSLFTCSLIEICRMHNVELSILCDKSSERRKEVCALADNVLCIERDEDDIDRFRIFVERMSNIVLPSALMKLGISDAYNLFKCNIESGLSINYGSITTFNFIGSMKEYWRQSINMENHSNNQIADN